MNKQTFSARRFLVPLSLAILLAAISFFAFAGPGGRGGMPGLQGPHGAGGEVFREEMLARRLDLNDAQRMQFQALNAAHREAIRPYVRNMMDGRREMRGLVHAEVFDESAVRALAAKQHQAMVEMMVLRARHRHDIRQLLSPEQRKQMMRRRYERDDDA